MASVHPVTPNRKPNAFQRLAERYRWTSRWNKIALWGALLAIITGFATWQWARPAWDRARMVFFLKLADGALERKDYKTASLAYRKALHTGHQDPRCWEALIPFMDQIQSPELIGIYERIANLEPDVPSHRYAQVEAAVRFGRLAQAEDILAALRPEWRNTPDYFRLEADLALRKRKFPEAETALIRLMELRPDDPEARFDLWFARLNGPDPQERANAEIALREIARDATAPMRTEARRALRDAYFEAGNPYEAGIMAEAVLAEPGATVRDRLLHLQAEVASNSFTVPNTLAALRRYAAEHPEDFTAVVDALVANKMEPEALRRWIEELPRETRNHPAVAQTLFRYFLLNREFDRAVAILRDSESPLRFPPDVLELALRAIAEEKAGNPNAEQTWMQAIYGAKANPQILRILAVLASESEWAGAVGRALVALTDAAPSDPSGWALLAQHETSTRNLAGSYKALQGLLRLNPHDVRVAGNWVLASTLLRKGDPAEVLNVARRAYDSTDPTDAQVATAYAIALSEQGRPAEALEIVERMSNRDRAEPSRAIYIGAVLAANGRNAEALEFFERSEQITPRLFAEEARLRRIWKDVAQGLASTAEEAAERMKRAEETDQAQSITAGLREELQRRSDPNEVQRILSTLKAEADSRRQPAPEVERLLREVREEEPVMPGPSPTASPTP